MHEIFDVFFTKSILLFPWFLPQIFSYINSNLPRIQIWMSFFVLSEYAERIFFCQAREKWSIIPCGSWAQLHSYKLFFEVMSLLKLLKNNFIPNIRNYLGTFTEYAVWISTFTVNSQNKVNLQNGISLYSLLNMLN